jgi:hypothetical protein
MTNTRSYRVSDCYSLFCEEVAIDNVRSHLVSDCYLLISEEVAIEFDV